MIPIKKCLFSNVLRIFKCGKGGCQVKCVNYFFRRSYEHHIYYLKLNQRVTHHRFYKPHIKAAYHALSGIGNK